MGHDQPREQTVEVFGDLADVLPYTQPVYRRTVRTRSVTFTCQRCGRSVTQQRFPGPTPRYCGDPCRDHAQRARTRDRVRRFREHQSDPDR